jgi:RNA polymerase sigma-70 factor (ECF subfamily)
LNRHVIVEAETGASWGIAEESVDQPASPITSVAGSEDERASAFERLANEHLDGSYRLARAILGRSGDAEDAVHDAFETAWRKWGSLRDPARFEAWFGRIVVNTCRDRLRRSARRRTDELDEQLPGHDPLAGMEVRDELDQALTRLKPDDQIVLALRYYRDLTVDDIATLMDVRPGTVMSRIHRAQARLRPLLVAHQDERR